APPHAEAALYFTPGQLVFQWVENGRVLIKPLATSSLRVAIADESVDSGWLASNVVRNGLSSAGPFMVGFYPAAVREFNCAFARGKASVLRGLRVPMPALIYIG